jgi:predicted TPR repeat methyltransferase
MSVLPPRHASTGDPILDRRIAYADALAAAGDHVAAADLLDQTAAVLPGFAPLWFKLGQAREKAGERGAAILAYERAAALDSDDVQGAGLALARLGARDAAGAMTPAYVRALFDDYAHRFDAHLMKTLGYRGPAVIMAALDAAIAATGREPHFDRAIDLGCGTGLMARAVHKRVDSLKGCDLSPAMVGAAEATGLYGEVTVEDAVSCLAARTDTGADLILAADVLVYMADLVPLLDQVARVLEPGGLFAFTAEAAPAGQDFTVADSGRFQHGEAHIRRLAREAGLDLIVLEPASTRMDRDRPVPGLVAVLARPGHP